MDTASKGWLKYTIFFRLPDEDPRGFCLHIQCADQTHPLALNSVHNYEWTLVLKKCNMLLLAMLLNL